MLSELFFKTGSDILAVPFHNFSPPKVQMFYNPKGSVLNFSDRYRGRQCTKKQGEMTAHCAFLQQKWKRGLQSS